MDLRCAVEPMWSFSRDSAGADVTRCSSGRFSPTRPAHDDGQVGMTANWEAEAAVDRCRSTSCRSWRRSDRSRQVTLSASVRSWRIPTSDRHGRSVVSITLLCRKDAEIASRIAIEHRYRTEQENNSLKRCDFPPLQVEAECGNRFVAQERRDPRRGTSDGIAAGATPPASPAAESRRSPTKKDPLLPPRSTSAC